jgi:virginiamycin B lyase
VTVFRSCTGEAPSRPPHLGQNFAPSGLGTPHVAQTGMSGVCVSPGPASRRSARPTPANIREAVHDRVMRVRVAILAAGLLAASACTSEDGLDPASPTVATSAPATPSSPTATARRRPSFREYRVPPGTHPHDVAPAPDGRVWYTAQGSGELGVLTPSSRRTRHIPLGPGSAPHGVIVGPDGAPWITDGGLNAIVRVHPENLNVTTFPLPDAGYANLNTAAFDGDGTLWFTGQSGVYGRVAPGSGRVEVFDAPRGEGPYGIATTPDGTVWLASLAGSYIARVRSSDGRLTVVDVPSPGGGARRIWSDSQGRLWVTEWYAGKLARYDPANRSWKEWGLPGDAPQPYAVFVDDDDLVWVTDFGANALVRFDPATERFRAFAFPSSGAEVRQLLGHPGEVWGAESGTDKLVVLRTG